MAAIIFTSKSEWAHSTLIANVNGSEWPHSNRTSKSECPVNSGFTHLLAKAKARRMADLQLPGKRGCAWMAAVNFTSKIERRE